MLSEIKKVGRNRETKKKRVLGAPQAEKTRFFVVSSENPWSAGIYNVLENFNNFRVSAGIYNVV